MKPVNFLKILMKKSIAVFLAFVLLFTSFIPAFQTPFSPQTVEAAENSCGVDSGTPTGANLQAKVGGVALDQAATFLSNMTEYTGAYYDASLDRIVFMGKTDTTAPKFDKDDLAISIRAIFFNNTIPAVSLESKPTDTNRTQPVDVKMYGGIEDTKFGQVLLDADYKLKQYGHGYDINNNIITSSVPTYKSVLKRYIELGPDPTKFNSSRWWIVPDLITVKKDDPTSSFVFDTVKMKVRTEPISMDNAVTWNQAALDFANDQTTNYDAYAQETPEYFKVKQLAKIVGVVKWIHDRGISTDMNWAKDYTPKYQATPREMPRLTTPWVDGGAYEYNMSGGVQYDTGNSYVQDNGIATSLKTSSQAVPTTKEDIHWVFTNNSQQYEAVAVAADAFRSLGAYSSAETDMSFPVAGDLSLAFIRAYSSYSGGQNGIGRGWNMFPAQLSDNKPDNPNWRAYCAGETLSHRYKLAFQGQGGLYETYTWMCPNGFVPDDSAYHSKVFDNADRTRITVRLKNQTEYTFKDELSGFRFQLLQIKDKNGNTINYNYDGTGKLISIADSKNHTITVNYNSQNLTSSIVDWSGRTVSYTYDGQGNLLTVTDPKLGVTTYTYDTNFKLTSITDREGKTVLTNTYTEEAKLATQKDAANIINTYSHDDVNRAVTVADNQVPSRTLKTVYDAKARILEQIDPLLKSVKYTYGTEFSPLTITDKNNNKITNTYDVSGNLTSVTYPDLKKVTFEYDSKNRVTKITDERYGASAKVTTFTYDASGNLIQSSEAGLATNFTYDTSGEVLTFIDPLVHKTTWTRDSFGNKLTEMDASNKTTAFEYDAIARLKKITDADTKTTSYTYDSNGNLLTQTNGAGTLTNIYDKENRLVKTTLPNNSVTELTYNTSGSLNSVKDALTSLTSYGYDAYQNLTSQQDALNRTTTYAYDQMNRQTQSTTPLGKLSKWEYDPNGNITKRIDANNKTTSYTYDIFNRLTKITYPDAKTVTYTYDNRGNMLSMVDAIGTTTYTYDNFDRLLTAKNPYGRQISYAYDASDNLTKITHPDTLAVNYTYDVNNRLVSVRDWNNSTVSYGYYNNGLLSNRTMPNGVTSTYSYDSANRLSSLEHAKSGSTLAKFAYERDSLGNITKATEEGSFFSTGAPTPTPTVTPTPTPTTSGQDLVITSMSVTPATPAAGSNFTISLKVKNQGTAPTGNVFVRFPYYYDLASAPTYTTTVNHAYSTNIDLAAGQETTINIASANISTSGSHTIWALADKENAVPETNENNNAFGPHNITVGPAATPTPTPTNTPTPTPTSGPTATPTPTPSQSGPDLVITNIITSPANPAKYQTFTISTTVKNQGTTGISNKLLKVAFYYDLSQPPTYTTTPSKSFSPAFTLAPGASQTVDYSGSYFTTSGAHNIRALVDQGQVLAETNENNNAAGPLSVTIAHTGFFDKVLATLGLRNIARFFTVPASYAQVMPAQFITTFSYDLLSRLTTANYPDAINYTFTYDKVDNRSSMLVATATQSGTTNYVYNNDNQLTGAGTTSFTYDSNGNQLQKVGSGSTTGFTYNFEDRLTKYTPPTGSATTYVYDGNNNRLAKVVGSTTTRFVTDILGDLSRTLAETNSFNSITKSYVYGLGLISQGQISATSRDYYLEDGQGNLRFVTDEVGNKVRSTEYDPFGNWRAANGQSNIHMLYQGQQLDNESSLYYLRARYYDPTIGRFISKDPVKGTLTLPQSQNPYAYALNNPINLSDPSGEQVAQFIQMCLRAASAVASRVGSAISSIASKNPAINVGPKLQHVIDNHTVGGSNTVGKSVFSKGEDVVKLIQQTEGVSPVKQAGGNFERVIDAGRIVGIDRNTQQPTSVYTVITDSLGNLITAFPGIP